MRATARKSRAPDMKWDGENWIGIFGNALHGSQRITHWMPLPTPPQEGPTT